jgi:hypothetical protein
MTALSSTQFNGDIKTAVDSALKDFFERAGGSISPRSAPSDIAQIGNDAVADEPEKKEVIADPTSGQFMRHLKRLGGRANRARVQYYINAFSLAIQVAAAGEVDWTVLFVSKKDEPEDIDDAKSETEALDFLRSTGITIKFEQSDSFTICTASGWND